MLRRRFLHSLLVFASSLPSAQAARAVGTQRSILLQTSPVAGFQYHDGETIWGGLATGQSLHLIREAHNSHDDKAVRVEWCGHKIGYVPRIENHAVAQLLDRGEKLSARIAGLKNSSNPWERVRFDVLLEA